MVSSIEAAVPTLPGVESRDEHDLRIWTAAAMWLGGGVAATAATIIPGEAALDVLALRWLAGLCVLASVISMALFPKASNSRLYLLTNIFSAIGEVGVCFACASSGGASSGFVGLYFFSVLYAAYFFRRSHACLHLALISVLAAAPLVYDSSIRGTQFPGRLVVLVACFWGMYAVIAQRKRRLLLAELTSRQRALSDSLTGLHNVRSLRERVSQRELAPGTGVVVLDVDDFKAVNTEYGHLAGDELLQVVGAGLLELSDERDCVARIGGDEFAMLVCDRTGPEIAALAKGCGPAIGRARRRIDPEWREVTVSVGVALWPEDGRTLSELLDAADRQMFLAKEVRKRALREVQAVLEESSASAYEDRRPAAQTRAQAPSQQRLTRWATSEPRERSLWRVGWERCWSRRPQQSTAAALTWLAAVAITLIVMLMPDADSAHVAAVAALLAGGVAVSLLLFALPASMSEAARRIAGALAIPGLALGVYLTGATHSPLLPLVFLLVAFAAYFSESRAALLRLAGAAVVCASPFAYASGAARTAFVVPFIALVTSASVLGGIILYSRRELAQAELAAEELALADPLTALPNRRAFTESVRDALAHLSGAPDDLMSVAMIDIDNFKRVNDRHGHAAGDEVLCAIADGLAAAVRKGDCLARIGGDEFALHAHGLDTAATRGLGDRCVRAVERAVRRAGYADCGISATVGFALFPEHGATLESLLQSADSALMGAKNEGKRQVVCARLREPVAR